jgi:hypothetical protein
MQLLQDSRAIRESIQQLFAGEGRKLAIVGFVGYGALDQLPHEIRNLTVICWPKAGATSPDGVRRLIRAGIDVHFCDRLHSKIYCAEGKGIIICSANLSSNALGNSGQHEYGVYLPNAPNFETLLSPLRYSKAEADALNKLDFEQNLLTDVTPDLDGNFAEVPSFLQYLESPAPKKWKLSCWSKKRKSSKPIREELGKSTGRTKWSNDHDVEPGEFHRGDIVLQLRTDEDGTILRANGTWLRVDVVLNIHGTPTILEFDNSWAKSSAPFTLDSKFKSAFKTVYNETEWDAVPDEQGIVTQSFLRNVREQM